MLGDHGFMFVQNNSSEGNHIDHTHMGKLLSLTCTICKEDGTSQHGLECHKQLIHKSLLVGMQEMMKNALGTNRNQSPHQQSICSDGYDKLNVNPTMSTDPEDSLKIPLVDWDSDKENRGKTNVNVRRKQREVPFTDKTNEAKSKSAAKSYTRLERHRKKFSQKRDLDRHRISHSNRRATCTFCGAMFDTAGQLVTHSLREHRIGALSCSICNEGLFNSLAGLARHKKLNHGLGKRKMRSHVQQRHNSETIKVRHDHVMSYGDAMGHVPSEYLQNPSNSSHSVNFTRCRCKGCDSYFSGRSNLMRHVKSKHSSQRFQRKQCDPSVREDYQNYIQYPEHWIILDEC